MLHLFLRVCDVLINLLITELRRLDGLDKIKPKKLDFTKITHIAKYQKFLNEDCKVSVHFYIDKECKTLKWRDLTGPEKLKIFNPINVPDLFPNLPKADLVQGIWKGFLVIHNRLSSRTAMSSQEVDNFKIEINGWLQKFLSVYQTKNVTPYIHLLICHIPEFLTKYGTIAPFAQQGLEKLNDIITKHYFRGTNHRTTNSLNQILNRLEELSDEGCVRSKEKHTCTLCKESGHKQLYL